MRNLTLTQAKQHNNAQRKTNRMDTRKLRKWYEQGYYMKANGRWCGIIGYSWDRGCNTEARKYCTAY